MVVLAFAIGISCFKPTIYSDSGDVSTVNFVVRKDTNLQGPNQTISDNELASKIDMGTSMIPQHGQKIIYRSSPAKGPLPQTGITSRQLNQFICLMLPLVGALILRYVSKKERRNLDEEIN